MHIASIHIIGTYTYSTCGPILLTDEYTIDSPGTAYIIIVPTEEVSPNFSRIRSLFLNGSFLVNDRL